MRRLQHRMRQRGFGDEAFTLPELMVAMVVFSVLLVMTVPLMTTFFNVDTNVTNTVGTVNQILPATTVLQRYLHSAVAPSSTAISPFVVTGSTYSASANQMSFYSNTGDQVASGALAGDPIGPRLVTLSISGPTTTSAYTLTLATQQAVSGTCPGSSPAMSQTNGATCSYTGQPSRLDFSISQVSNGAASSTNPIFQYIAGINASGLPNVITPGSPPSGWTCNTSACVPVSASAIQSVTGVQIDVETQAKGGSLTSFRSTVLFFAPSYSANVG
jgi:prepilin-type N-terminal cleavage/methylation domain-containing protein